MHNSWPYFLWMNLSWKEIISISLYEIVLKPWLFSIERLLNFLNRYKFDLFNDQKLSSVKLIKINISDIFLCSSVIEKSKQRTPLGIFVLFTGKAPLVEFEHACNVSWERRSSSTKENSLHLWGQEGVIYSEMRPRNQKITAKLYCQHIRHLILKQLFEKTNRKDIK